jgi:hypothetical protein
MFFFFRGVEFGVPHVDEHRQDGNDSLANRRSGVYGRDD